MRLIINTLRWIAGAALGLPGIALGAIGAALVVLALAIAPEGEPDGAVEESPPEGTPAESAGDGAADGDLRGPARVVALVALAAIAAAYVAGCAIVTGLWPGAERAILHGDPVWGRLASAALTVLAAIRAAGPWLTVPIDSTNRGMDT